MPSKDKLLWMGRHILSKDHVADLEQRAAINEFDKKLPREQAEEEAHKHYVREHHSKAAAYHLERAVAAKSMGKLDEAKAHNAHYNLHLKAMGHNPYEPTPPEVKMHLGQPANNLFGFENHEADQLIGHHLGKAVLPFKAPEGPGQDLGQDAKVLPFKKPPTLPPPTAEQERALMWWNGGNPLPICRHCTGKGSLWGMRCKHCGGQGIIDKPPPH